MVYVGIDLHRKRSHVAVVEEDGSQTLSRRLVNDREVFRELLRELGDDAEFALEATYGWEWLAELLEEEGCELHLASVAHQGDRFGAGEDRCCRCAHARAPAARRSAAGGLRRAARAARPARSAAPTR